MRIEATEIENRLGIPPYTIELQRIVEQRIRTVRELQKETVKKPSTGNLKLVRERFELEKDEKQLQKQIDEALAKNKPANK